MAASITPVKSSAGNAGLNPPCPPGNLLLGHCLEMRRDPFSFLTDCAKNYGDVVRLRLGRLTLLLNHPDDIRHVLVTNPLNYHKTGFPVRFKRFFGNGLITSEDKVHRHQRKLVQPFYVRHALDRMATLTTHYIGEMIGRWENGRQLNIVSELITVGALVSSRFVFGIDSREFAMRLHDYTARCHANLVRKMQKWIAWPDSVPIHRNRVYARLNNEADDIVFDLIRQRRQSIKDASNDGQTDNGKSHKDILSFLLQAKDSQGQALPDQQIRDEVMSLFLAGVDPVARSLSWTWYRIAQNPKIEKRMLQEMTDAMGDRKTPQPEDVNKLPFAKAVFNETLRLHPHAWLLPRKTLKQDRLPSGYTVPAGSEVLVSPYIVHRDPRWFDRPLQFDPERFMEPKDTTGPGFAFFPYGSGPRNCIGSQYAEVQAITMLANIMPKVRLELTPGQEDIQPETLNALTLQPKGDAIHFKVIKR